ncbi:MAG: PorT family protein [Tannerella sp.]|jgi:hypothetical protein|nr:PorT family protein [Tannerella sp.]
MKKWICMGIMLLSLSGAEARVGFGIRAGVAYASLTQLVDEKVAYGDRLGFCVAGIVDIPFSRKFSLRPELVILNLGGAYDVEYPVEEQPYLRMERIKSSYYSLQMPLNVTYKILVNNWQFCVYGGPSVAVSTPVREKVLPEERKFRPFDVGMGVGFHVQHRRVFTSIYTHSGLIDRQSRKQSHESQLYQNSVIFSLGYWF